LPFATISATYPDISVGREMSRIRAREGPVVGPKRRRKIARLTLAKVQDRAFCSFVIVWASVICYPSA
jgi:hypothetical protein